MCLSLILGISVIKDKETQAISRIIELAQQYGYGCSLGENSIIQVARDNVLRIMPSGSLIFELHDLPEPHCACDIDDDIRSCTKLGRKSRFFEFVIKIDQEVTEMALIFFQDVLPIVDEMGRDNVRRASGNCQEFEELLSKWNTWQVEGFEPNRQAYYIADESPLLFTFK